MGSLTNPCLSDLLVENELVVIELGTFNSGGLGDDDRCFLVSLHAKRDPATLFDVHLFIAQSEQRPQVPSSVVPAILS
jgi:hypothetical protein